MDNIYSALARLYKWTPDYIDKLTVPGGGYHSLKFWAKDAKKYIDEINKSRGALN